MIFSRLKIRPNHYVSSELTLKYPVRVQVVTIQGNESFGVVESLNGDGHESEIKSYLQELSQHRKVEVTYASPQTYWTKAVVEPGHKSIIKTILSVGSMSLMPIVHEQGAQTHDVLSPSPTVFQSLMDNLRAQYRDVDLVQLQPSPPLHPQPLLTQRQEQILKVAYKAGLYDIPKRTTLDSLSKQLGTSKATIHEHLRKAEVKLVSDYFRGKMSKLHRIV